MLLTIIAFLLVLTILVLVHEAGHYFTAKILGVKVEEFGFGFPPRAWGKKIGETIYSINWLPIGGFVKLYGEDEAGAGRLQIPNSKSQIQNKYKIQNTKYQIHRAFYARPTWQRGIIVFAGVFMNFLLATILLTYLVGKQGIPTPGNQVIIAQVQKNTPAQKAGLTPGDQILSVDNIKITSPDQLITYTKSHLGKSIDFKIINNKYKIIHTFITPRVHYPANQGAMGVAIATNIVAKRYPWYMWPIVGLKEALLQSWMIVQGLGQLLSQLFTHGTIPQDLAGPVGIAQVTGQFVAQGVDATLSLLALLSLNLAILNVLPIPALDGGRLFFILIEAVSRKKVSPQVQGYAHAIGMAVLLVLIVLITFHDILRIVSGQSLLPK